MTTTPIIPRMPAPWRGNVDWQALADEGRCVRCGDAEDVVIELRHVGGRSYQPFPRCRSWRDCCQRRGVCVQCERHASGLFSTLDGTICRPCWNEAVAAARKQGAA